MVTSQLKPVYIPLSWCWMQIIKSRISWCTVCLIHAHENLWTESKQCFLPADSKLSFTLCSSFSFLEDYPKIRTDKGYTDISWEVTKMWMTVSKDSWSTNWHNCLCKTNLCASKKGVVIMKFKQVGQYIRLPDNKWALIAAPLLANNRQ